MTTRLLIAATVAVILSCYTFEWRVELPPLPNITPRLHAQAAQDSDTVCEVWADIKPWAITRCESWETGEVCFVATSGMLVCKWEQ